MLDLTIWKWRGQIYILGTRSANMNISGDSCPFPFAFCTKSWKWMSCTFENSEIAPEKSVNALSDNTARGGGPNIKILWGNIQICQWCAKYLVAMKSDPILYWLYIGDNFGRLELNDRIFIFASRLIQLHGVEKAKFGVEKLKLPFGTSCDGKVGKIANICGVGFFIFSTFI